MEISLPEGLPPGEFMVGQRPDVWASHELPKDVERLWARLLAQQPVTGLVPFLCPPEAVGEPQDLAEVDAVVLEESLASDFAAYRRRMLPYWSDPTPVEVPEGVEPWPHDPGPPFERWPGLAPAVAPTDASAVSTGAARAAARLADDPAAAGDGVRLLLVPARRGADIPAVLGWRAEAPLPLLCALLRSWEDRFGAQVVGALHSELHVRATRPPRDPRAAELLALEHVLTTADNIVDDPPTPFPDYAAALVDRADWSFWWD